MKTFEEIEKEFRDNGGFAVVRTQKCPETFTAKGRVNEVTQCYKSKKGFKDAMEKWIKEFVPDGAKNILDELNLVTTEVKVAGESDKRYYIESENFQRSRQGAKVDFLNKLDKYVCQKMLEDPVYRFLNDYENGQVSKGDRYWWCNVGSRDIAYGESRLEAVENFYKNMLNSSKKSLTSW